MTIKCSIGMFFIAIILSTSLFAEKIATLPEIFKPTSIAMDNHQLYVTEKTSVAIYSMKDFKLIKKFGKKGEGPQEFLQYVRVVLQPDHLQINSQGKISFFSKNGVYQKELRVRVFSWIFKPIGDKYVGFALATKDGIRYNSINFFDAQLNQEKEIHRNRRFLQDKGYINPMNYRDPEFYICDGKIILDDDNGIIHCFDSTGKKILTIDPKIEKAKVTAADEKRYRDFYKNDPRYRDLYPIFQLRAKFPEYFPPIQFITVDDNKIYLFTFKKEDEKFAYLIYGLDGKLLKKSFAPLNYTTIIEIAPTAVKNGKLYQMVENLDQETWELHSISID